MRGSMSFTTFHASAGVAKSSGQPVLGLRLWLCIANLRLYFAHRSDIFAQSSGDWRLRRMSVEPSAADFHGAPTTTGTPSSAA